MHQVGYLPAINDTVISIQYVVGIIPSVSKADINNAQLRVNTVIKQLLCQIMLSVFDYAFSDSYNSLHIPVTAYKKLAELSLSTITTIV